MGWEVRGRFKTEQTNAYLWLIHVDVRQKPKQYCKAIILQLKINRFLKITIRYHFSPTGLAIFKKQKITSKDVQKWEHVFCWRKCKMLWPLQKILWQFLKNLKLKSEKLKTESKMQLPYEL